ncbi:hypothetical protein TSAR_003646 [Trichomalopsis sarcophagae]|uniref:Uncharacterized protein n=1 Tax=Trichomalopsis sarcophagae TaxID=543379 RepID=A0A232FCF5_9HYME|nr:hypothetical protein TSAR_003646 [Trichomalopsis sarcophagae]
MVAPLLEMKKKVDGLKGASLRGSGQHGPGAQSQPNRDTTQSNQTRAVFSPYSLKLEKVINKPHHVHENGEDFTEHSNLTTSTRTGRKQVHEQSCYQQKAPTDASTRATSQHHHGRATLRCNYEEQRQYVWMLIKSSFQSVAATTTTTTALATCTFACCGGDKNYLLAVVQITIIKTKVPSSRCKKTR